MSLIMYCVVLLYAAWIDWKTRKIPNKTVLAIIGLSLCETGVWGRIMGAFILTLPFLFLGVRTDGIGGGDIKFIFANGCYLGTISYFGIVLGLILIVIRIIPKKIRKIDYQNERVAMAPFLVFGYLLTLLLKHILRI